jgi:co-chaperonin GroES (HSP10)
VDNVDVTKLKARGPWVLVEVEEPKKQTEGGLYLPDGNLYDRIGYAVGKVLSAGKGYNDEIPGGKKRFQSIDLTPGDRVVFRGHMRSANPVGDKCCFVHAKDLLGVLGEGEELEHCLPYNN